MIHNAWAVVNIIARLLCRFLIDCVNAFNLVLLMINKIRNGVACVGTCNDRSRVVGQNHNFVIIILLSPSKSIGKTLSSISSIALTLFSGSFLWPHSSGASK